MRGSLLLCLAGAATSFVWEPRRLALLRAMPTGTAAERVAALLARGSDSGYTLPDESEHATPEQFAEWLGLPGCRAWASESRPSDTTKASVLVPWDDTKPCSVEKAKVALRSRAPRDDDAPEPKPRSGRKTSAEARRAGPAYEPQANRSAGRSRTIQREKEIREEEKKWSGTAEERQLTLMGGSAQVARRSVSVADWQYWKGEGAYPTTPGTPGFGTSFFYARKHSAMYQVLERETGEGMTADDCVLDLYQGADREATINRGDTAQACQCLATAGVITNDEIGQLVHTRRFFDRLEAPSKFEGDLSGSRVFDGRCRTGHRAWLRLAPVLQRRGRQDRRRRRPRPGQRLVQLFGGQ
jgi:hypothetical protein